MKVCKEMKISTEIGSISRIVGERKAVEYVAKAGFDGWDLSMIYMFRYSPSMGGWLESDHPLRTPNYLEFVRELNRIGLDNGIVCNQAHAPFPLKWPGMIDYVKRALECAAEVGAEICVVHPINEKGPEENKEVFLELLPLAKSYGIKIATENMWCWDKETDRSSFAACATAQSFCEHIDIVGDPDLVACLDIGHAEMAGSGDGAATMIRALGHRLQALHIHDNDQWKDSHKLPFTMKIDFAAVAKALKDIGYRGWFTLEADSHLKDCAAEDVFAGVVEMADSMRRFAQLYERV